MANKYMDTEIFDRAAVFAVKAHGNTERRGKNLPYVIHVFEAAEIAATITTDQELLAAALLHDVIEDTEYTEADIEKEFGPRVAALVASESDVVIEGVSEEDSWHARKQAAIDRIAASSHDAKIVAMGDKLSNMRAIYRDYRSIGDELWNRFHVTDKAEHAWHYRGLRDSLSELSDTEAYQEFASLVEQIFGE